MKKQKGNLSLFLIIIILTVGVAIYLFVSRGTYAPQNSYTTPSPSPTNVVLKTFQSKLMKFSIATPAEFDSVENLGRVTISASQGKLYVDRNATNFYNLDDYLIDLNNRNKPEVLNENEELIDNYQAVSRLIRFGTGEVQKEIIIFADGWIYNIFTNVESLYSNLDQIAQSFRYAP